MIGKRIPAYRAEVRLRIDEGRIHSLFNLSGELMVAKNALRICSGPRAVVGHGDLGRNIARANEGSTA